MAKTARVTSAAATIAPRALLPPLPAQAAASQATIAIAVLLSVRSVP